jgi:hypothetical protein
MIIFGHTPREWIRRTKNNKLCVAGFVVAFILGAIIF